MTDLAEGLVAAYQTCDAVAFAALAKRLHDSVDDRRETAKRLVQVVREPDARRAEVAVTSMLVTGIASEQEWCKELVQAAETIFTPQVLSQLVEDVQQRARISQVRAFPPRLRLLRGLIAALTRTSEPHGLAFLEALQKRLVGTSLYPYVSKWRQNS